eukprot:6451622-Amphidinium_carterae.2
MDRVGQSDRLSLFLSLLSDNRQIQFYITQCDMVAELRLTEGETNIIEDKQREENNMNNKNEIDENNIVTLHVHMLDDNTIGMMGKMNIELPISQFTMYTLRTTRTTAQVPLTWFTSLTLRMTTPQKTTQS